MIAAAHNPAAILYFAEFIPRVGTAGKVDRSAIQGRSINRRATNRDGLFEILRNPPVAKRKEDLPLIKLALFGDEASPAGSYRHDANLLEVWGVEGDYDGGQVSIAQAAELLQAAGIVAFLYTTPSHTPECPRWRVLAPCSRAHMPAERAALVAKLNGVLGGILAPESFTLSQAFFYGRVEGAEYCDIETTGVEIDLAKVDTLPVYPSGRNVDEFSTRQVSPGMELQRDLDLARVTPETLADLRSALGVNPTTSKPWIDPDDRVTWVAVGQNLRTLGEDGKELWMEWSARSPKFNDGRSDPEVVWRSFGGDGSMYTAVFSKAQAAGWVNPRSAAALRAAETAASRTDRTDAGNMAVLYLLTDGDLRWVPEKKEWLWWNGARWEVDPHGLRAQEAAIQVAEQYLKEAATFEDQAKSDSLSQADKARLLANARSCRTWAGRCRNKPTLDKMLGLAKADPRFVILATDLDRDPYLFGVDNGVVDLRVGSLRDVCRDDYVTRRSSVAFDPEARAPRWEKFIDEITSAPVPLDLGLSRPAYANYLQRLLGYMLTGSVSEHKMFIAVGEGSNGKSVMVDVFAEVLGSYYQTVPPEVLMASRGGEDAERATPNIVRLAGARAVVCSESKATHKLNAALIKQQTGDARMTGRALHGMPITFDITHKILLLTNHKPNVDHLDGAIKGRIHMLPFDMRWNRPGHPEPDPTLPDGDKLLMETLKSELPGILAWLVRGAVAYLKDGLVPPAEVTEMTLGYLKEQDSFRMWLDECKSCDPKDGQSPARLFGSYQNWCTENGYAWSNVGTAIALGKRLTEAKIPLVRTGLERRYGLQAPSTWGGFPDVMQ